MNKNLSRLFKNVNRTVTKHSPEILTGLGIAGMLTTTVLAIKATPKAIRLLDDRKDELEVEKLPAVEIIKTTWKCYVPTAITCAVSIACLVGGSTVSIKRNAALATAYKISESALKTYKESVIETIGEKQEQLVQEKVAKKQIEENPSSSSNKIIMTGKNECLCYESVSKSYFYSNRDTILHAGIVLGERMLSDMYVNMDDLCDELELDHMYGGDKLGWDINVDGVIKMTLHAVIDDKTGEPVIVINYENPPRYDYDRY